MAGNNTFLPCPTTRRSSGGGSPAEKVPVSSTTLFGNVAEELERTRALQTELLTVRKALDAYSSKVDSNNSSRRRVKSAKKYDKKYSKKYDKKSAKKYSKKASGELEQCQAELAKRKNEASYLFIQTASACQIQRSTDNDGETSYKLVTDTISEDTYVFSDRPYRVEGTVPTTDFSAAWNDMFQSSNPNVGMTLVSDEQVAVGPLVVEFSEPDYQDNGQLAYTIEQSPNQDGVLSIESIFDGRSPNSVSFESCCFFIDIGSFDCGRCVATGDTIGMGGHSICIGYNGSSNNGLVSFGTDASINAESPHGG